jgi:hypothetical protein
MHKQPNQILFYHLVHHTGAFVVDDVREADHYVRRQVELEPWRKEAHQQLMRILADELDVEPSAETTALYEQIRYDARFSPCASGSLNDLDTHAARRARNHLLSARKIERV